MTSNEFKETSTFKEGDQVAYIPRYANGDIMHKDVERGVVTSVDEKYVFVRFYEEFISKACLPGLLTHCG